MLWLYKPYAENYSNTWHTSLSCASMFGRALCVLWDPGTSSGRAQKRNLCQHSQAYFGKASILFVGSHFLWRIKWNCLTKKFHNLKSMFYNVENDQPLKLRQMGNLFFKTFGWKQKEMLSSLWIIYSPKLSKFLKLHDIHNSHNVSYFLR